MTGYVATAAVDIEATPQRVWRGMTDPAEIAAYMAGTRVTTTWEVGTPITWDGEWEGKPYQDRGEVLEVEPERRLVVTHYSPLTGAADAPENYHRVEYVVTPTADGTRVELSQDGCDTPEQAAQFGAHWQSFLEGLKRTAEA